MSSLLKVRFPYRWCRALLLLAGVGMLWAGQLAAQEMQAAGEYPIHKSCIDEPVFGHTACIYEANPGAAETVVLVHGLNGQALRDWGEQIPALARRYHVLTFDLPGFGDSSKDGGYYSPSRYARFIHFVTQRYARRPFSLVGHSMGGAIVLRYSGDYPQEVKRLLLVDVAGVLHRMAYARMLAASWLEDHALYGHRLGGFFDRMAYKFMTKIEGISSAGNEYLARKLLEHELIEADPAVIAAYTLANEDLNDALQHISMPVLLLWGEQDRVAPLRTAHALKARLPQARLVTFPGAGHSPMRDAAASFNGELLAFLQQEAPPSEGGDKLPQSVPPSGRRVSCRHQNERVYEGSFERLELHGCKGVIIRNARIGQLLAEESVVTINNSDIGSANGTALKAVGAELTLTATTLSGEVAIHASRSRLDLAAVTLDASHEAVTGGSGSSLIFSISEVHSTSRNGGLHGYFEVDHNTPL